MAVYFLRNGSCHCHCNADRYTKAYSITKVQPFAEGSSNSATAPLALLLRCPGESEGLPEMFFCLYRECMRKMTT